MKLIIPIILLALQGCATVQFNPDRWERPKVNWQDTYDRVQYNKAVKKFNSR